MKYKVLYSKYFVNGNLQNLMIDATLTFPTLELACEYVSFLHSHIEKPVKAYSSSDYTCHLARIEPIEKT